MVGNNHFHPISLIFLATRAPKFNQCGPKVNKFWTLTQQVYTPSLICIDYVNTSPDNGRKPPFSVIYWPLEGQNWANIDQKQINSEHSTNQCIEIDWVIIFPDNGQKPQAYARTHGWTLTIPMSRPDFGGGDKKVSQTDRQTGRRTDGVRCS